MPVSPLTTYKSSIQADIERGIATEETYRPYLKRLVEDIGPPGFTATNEPKRVACGAPDFQVSQNTPHGPLTIGYIETKDIGASLDEAERSEQLCRYLPALRNLILTDYLEFRWYVDGQQRLSARLASKDASGRLLPVKGGAEEVAALLRDFLAHQAEPIQRPRELAQRMARLTHLIRDIVVRAFDTKAASATLCDLRQAFAEVLIPDLSVSDFADMFAQTLAYGLFAARCNHRSLAPFRRQNAAREIPKTNPFLRKLFTTITGPELEDEPFAGIVDDLAQLLADTDMESVLADFGQQTRREDPIVHFYETFLKQYNPKERKIRGVYFTPEPVVSYIVRSVDYLLKERFGCPDGLADSSLLPPVAQPSTAGAVPPPSHRVLILDPACGTATFLYAIIDLIRERFMEEGNAGRWSSYVREHLLPRLFGFELLMAPYAVAHFKLGMQLAAQDLPEHQRTDWAYDFGEDDRLGVYLTNTLEEAARRSEVLFGRWISDEANEASKIKRDLPIMVVLGNPPYSGHSANKGKWIRGLLRGRLPDGTRVPSYYEVDGKPLGERNPKWLQDDYVKFIRFAQWRIERTGAGILAFITNHGYLDNPTFRGMRQQLMSAFTDIYVLDLHGSTRKREQPPHGVRDQNVFEIQQGVAIGVLVRDPRKQPPAAVHHAELWELREAKYAWLHESGLQATGWEQLTPSPPSYLFIPAPDEVSAEYHAQPGVTELMPFHSMALNTHRDAFVIDFDLPTLLDRIRGFRDASPEALHRMHHGMARERAAHAQRELRTCPDWRSPAIRCLYRPFDVRFLYWSHALIDRPRPTANRHMREPNVSLLTTRQTQEPFATLATNMVCGQHKIAAVYDGTLFFPLYLYPSEQEIASGLYPAGERRPNLAPALVADLPQRLGLTFLPDGTGDLERTFGPEDVFHYIYAVLYSPTYRSRYAKFLKRDFPRIPLTTNLDLFRALCRKGAELVALHLMESPALRQPITNYPVPGMNLVEKGHPRYLAPGERDPATNHPLERGRVYLTRENKRAGKRGQYFEGVPPEVWAFRVGGYQVCERWLKDRRGRNLSSDDLTHYERIIVALAETIRLMREIDEVIDAHGGWPIQ